MLDLKLYVYNIDESEVLVDFCINITAIQGYYYDPYDDTVINLLSYGQLYTVVKTHQLMAQLNNRLN
jgi:hypothetical protein